MWPKCTECYSLQESDMRVRGQGSPLQKGNFGPGPEWRKGVSSSASPNQWLQEQQNCGVCTRGPAVRLEGREERGQWEGTVQKRGQGAGHKGTWEQGEKFGFRSKWEGKLEAVVFSFRHAELKMLFRYPGGNVWTIEYLGLELKGQVGTGMWMCDLINFLIISKSLELDGLTWGQTVGREEDWDLGLELWHLGEKGMRNIQLKSLRRSSLWGEWWLSVITKSRCWNVFKKGSVTHCGEAEGEEGSKVGSASGKTAVSGNLGEVWWAAMQSWLEWVNKRKDNHKKESLGGEKMEKV